MAITASSRSHIRKSIYQLLPESTVSRGELLHLLTFATSSSDLERLWSLVELDSLLRESMERWESDRTSTWLSSAIPVALMGSLALTLEGEIAARYAMLCETPGVSDALTLALSRKLPHLTSLDTF